MRGASLTHLLNIAFLSPPYYSSHSRKDPLKIQIPNRDSILHAAPKDKQEGREIKKRRELHSHAMKLLIFRQAGLLC